MTKKTAALTGERRLPDLPAGFVRLKMRLAEAEFNADGANY